MASSRTPRGRELALLAAAALLSTASATAQTQPRAGPEVGARAPAFEASDQSGAARTFEDLAGENGLLLLFFRSADW